mmetsp:Transcript_21186/g.54246  ORF Transcript_21186/g.54246 Transcript_21186/m.54246 type:complete len:204 (+) Transcript_21186:236-847(+)
MRKASTGSSCCATSAPTADRGSATWPSVRWATCAATTSAPCARDYPTRCCGRCGRSASHWRWPRRMRRSRGWRYDCAGTPPTETRRCSSGSSSRWARPSSRIYSPTGTTTSSTARAASSSTFRRCRRRHARRSGRPRRRWRSRDSSPRAHVSCSSTDPARARASSRCRTRSARSPTSPSPRTRARSFCVRRSCATSSRPSPSH